MSIAPFFKFLTGRTGSNGVDTAQGLITSEKFTGHERPHAGLDEEAGPPPRQRTGRVRRMLACTGLRCDHPKAAEALGVPNAKKSGRTTVATDEGDADRRRRVRKRQYSC